MGQDRGARFLAHAFGHAGNVNEAHLGRGVFDGLEEGRQLVEPLVGHFDDSQVWLEPGIATDVGVLVRQGVEQGGLAGPGQTRDPNLHAATSLLCGLRRGEDPLDLAALFEVLVLSDEKAHPLGDNLDAVAQRQPQLVGFVNGPLQRRQAGHIVQGLHLYVFVYCSFRPRLDSQVCSACGHPGGARSSRAPRTTRTLAAFCVPMRPTRRAIARTSCSPARRPSLCCSTCIRITAAILWLPPTSTLATWPRWTSTSPPSSWL